MISNYLTDRLVIVDIKVDDWGVVTETEGDEIIARIEDENILVLNQFGKEVAGNMRIFLDKGQTIKYNDKIKIKKKNEIAYDQPDKKFVLHRITNYGMFKKKIDLV